MLIKNKIKVFKDNYKKNNINIERDIGPYFFKLEYFLCNIVFSDNQ